MHTPAIRCGMMTAAVFCGHVMFGVGSARGEVISSVTADLVDLTVAVSDTLAEIEEADLMTPYLDRQTKKGFVNRHEVLKLHFQRKASQRKLELLRFLIDAELKAAEERSRTLNALHERGTANMHLELIGANERGRFLRLLKEASSTSNAEVDQAASPRESNTNEPVNDSPNANESPSEPDPAADGN